MVIDLDKVAIEAEKMIPWDVGVKMNGKDYRLKRLSPGDFARLSRPATEEQVKAMLADVFEGEAPEVGAYNITRVMLAIQASIEAHLKKTALCEAKIIREMAGLVPTGSTR